MAISGVVCRCGNYPHEVEAILAAARAGGGATGTPPLSNQASFGLQAGGTSHIPGPRSIRPSRFTATPRARRSPRSSVHTRPLDGYAKATGRARYAGDIGFHLDDPVRQPLFAKAVRCPHAHAAVVSIDDRRARALPGVRAIVTYRDVEPMRRSNARSCQDVPASSARPSRSWPPIPRTSPSRRST